MTIGATSRLRRTTDSFVHTVLDDELVFMDVDNGRICSLKGTGRRTWEGIGEDGAWVTVGALIEALCAEFEVDEDACLRDVAVLLEELDAAGLIELVRETR